jgi:(1->4)-alpha-D-glucan 1-alpha-D-glucosylmutase
VRLLDALDAVGSSVDADTVDDASLKLWMTRRLLQIRRTDLDAFIGPRATYAPIDLRGARADDAIAFTRGSRVVVVAPIRPVAVERAGWGDTTIALPDGLWFDALRGVATGGGGAFRDVVSVADVAHHGCTVLIRTGGNE